MAKVLEELTTRHTGRIVAIKGAVVDVHFPLELPDIYHALIVQSKNNLYLEVFEHLTNHTVRRFQCLIMIISQHVPIQTRT